MTILLRFSTYDYIQRLQKEGHLFCNSIQTFAEYKDDINRGDEYENIFEQDYSENGILNIKSVDEPNQWLQIQYKNQLVKSIASEHFVNIFCLYSLNSEDYKENEIVTIPKEIKEMGEFCLIILNMPEFELRVKGALLRRGFGSKLDYIKYIDYDKFCGKKTVFEKPIHFSYQKEYRVAINNDSKLPIELFIGNIEDISTIRSTNEINEIKFSFG